MSFQVLTQQQEDKITAEFEAALRKQGAEIVNSKENYWVLARYLKARDREFCANNLLQVALGPCRDAIDWRTEPKRPAPPKYFLQTNDGAKQNNVSDFTETYRSAVRAKIAKQNAEVQQENNDALARCERAIQFHRRNIHSVTYKNREKLRAELTRLKKQLSPVKDGIRIEQEFLKFENTL